MTTTLCPTKRNAAFSFSNRFMYKNLRFMQSLGIKKISVMPYFFKDYLKAFYVVPESFLGSCAEMVDFGFNSIKI